MKILLINKFLYPKGGAETYVFKLAILEQSYPVSRKNLIIYLFKYNTFL